MRKRRWSYIVPQSNRNTSKTQGSEFIKIIQCMMQIFEKVFPFQSFKLAPPFVQNPVSTPPAHHSRSVSFRVSFLQRDPPWPPHSLLLHGTHHVYNHAVVLRITDLPWQKMRLCPDKPIVSWKYLTLKMYCRGEGTAQVVDPGFNL